MNQPIPSWLSVATLTDLVAELTARTTPTEKKRLLYDSWIPLVELHRDWLWHHRQADLEELDHVSLNPPRVSPKTYDQQKEFEKRRARRQRDKKVYEGASKGRQGLRWVPKLTINEVKPAEGTAHQEAIEIAGGTNNLDFTGALTQSATDTLVVDP